MQAPSSQGTCPDDAPWAHSPPSDQADRPPHRLDDHLSAVAHIAAAMAPPRLAALAALAGQWHDLGKLRPGFQRHIRSAADESAHLERVADRDKTHSAAGALWAMSSLSARLGRQGVVLARMLQYVIAGHHAGLADWHGGLARRLASPEALAELEQAQAHAAFSRCTEPPHWPTGLTGLPMANEAVSGQPGRLALWVRMLFSALVDADFLDTEAYMDPSRADQRSGIAAKGSRIDVAVLSEALREYLDRLTVAEGPVNRMRARVLTQCREKALRQPGCYRLTVPTGGGKTLSSLAFALDHAKTHGLNRVVYAIPYTSIIEQTAQVFRRVFTALGDDVVLEHHSSVDPDPEREGTRLRLAAENWDAPLIVTTNVQLFESLFAARTSRCRKLHRLQRSVIVLDEAQQLPLAYLQPVVDVLRWLIEDFGCCVLLCTATQPVLDVRTSSFDPQRGLQRVLPLATEIVDDVPALYAELERVQVHLPADFGTARSWDELADEIATHDAVLAIVSKRADAATLFHALEARTAAGTCLHLSAQMCAQHRSDVVAEITARLLRQRECRAAGMPLEPLRVVATQVVEAGVDLDFPVVYRAMAGLDSVAQAAGRCNREGKLPGLGQVHVFVPPGTLPSGSLKLARDVGQRVWAERPDKPLALPWIERYFTWLLAECPSVDAQRIGETLCMRPDAQAQALPIGFRTAADAFRLIDDAATATVLVRYQSPNSTVNASAWIDQLQRHGPSRGLLRKLQRWGVSLYDTQVQALLAAGDIEEANGCPGLYVQREGWHGFYDGRLGVQATPGQAAATAYIG